MHFTISCHLQSRPHEKSGRSITTTLPPKMILPLQKQEVRPTAAFAINGSPHSAADHNGMIWARNDAEMTESSWKGKNEQPLNDVLSGKP